MLRKKALRNKHRLPIVEVNIVSLMDILTTLLFFLVFAANFNKFSIIEGKAFPKGTSSEEDKKPTFALDITIQGKTKARVYLSPVSKLSHQRKNSLRRHIKRYFKGNEQLGYLSNISGRSSKDLQRKIQALLVPIKQSFPLEMKAVMTVADPIPYQNMIDLIGSIRSLGHSKRGFKTTNALGKTEKTKVLFPYVLISELNGGS